MTSNAVTLCRGAADMNHVDRKRNVHCCARTLKMMCSLPWLRLHPVVPAFLTTILVFLLSVQVIINISVSGTYRVEPRLMQALYVNNTMSSPPSSSPSSSSSSRTGRGLLTQIREGYRKSPSMTFGLYDKMGLGGWFGFFSSRQKQLPPCLFPPHDLVSQVSVSYQSLSWRQLEDIHRVLERGGKWRPHNCTSPYRVAIIVPYRDRVDHLKIFLNHLHPFLRKQRIAYGIYVVEQDPYTPFNRGLLLNIGYLEAMADDMYDCAIFHDVDLLPENENNLYTCPDQPRHMSVAVDELAYRLPYTELFGGVEAFRKDHFEKINGFSNVYFGWGGEDDDLYARLEHRGLNLTRYSPRIARYSMMRHRKNTANPARFNFLKHSKERIEKDGLNSLLYNRVKLEKRKLFTWIYVSVNQTAILNKLNMSNVESEPSNVSRIQITY